jgi:exodeoxyribonuclease VIII
MKPGIYTNLSLEQYHTDPAVSKSTLDAIHKSYIDYENKKRNVTVSNDAFILGNAVHTVILEPDRFNERYICGPEDRRGLKWKDAVAEAMEENRILLIKKEYDFCNRAYDAVSSHPIARILLTKGTAESSHFFDTRFPGLRGKCRPDYMRGDFLVDLKTTSVGGGVVAYGYDFEDSDTFNRSIKRYRYHVQAAWYLDGVNLTTGKNYQNFYFIAVEKQMDPEFPITVSIHSITEEYIQRGRQIYERDLEKLHIYLTDPERYYDKETSPDYTLRINVHSLSDWEKRLAEEF